MCGKNVSDGVTVTFPAGSPPRVREKLNQIVANGIAYGITPACAGKTRLLGRRQKYCWDHPRVCGKNKPTKFTEPQAAGSPPRVREKLRPSVEPIALSGITPACAGKTCFKCIFGVASQDHPRVCGKN